MQQNEDTPTTSVSLTLEHNGLKISVSVTGPKALKEAERLLDRAFDFVELEEDED